jgi:hypothetical protein
MLKPAIRSRTGIIFAATLILVLAGCASSYTPSPDRPFEPIPEFTSQQSLLIVNAQDDTTEVKTGPFLVNRRAWTDVAIQIAERELKKRGVRFTQSASRSLHLTVTNVRYEVGLVKIETQIDMRVVTGDGYTGRYTSRNSSVMAAVPRRQVDGAMMRAVVEMLKDPKIVSYLTQ